MARVESICGICGEHYTTMIDLKEHKLKDHAV